MKKLLVFLIIFAFIPVAQASAAEVQVPATNNCAELFNSLYPSMDESNSQHYLDSLYNQNCLTSNQEKPKLRTNSNFCFKLTNTYADYLDKAVVNTGYTTVQKHSRKAEARTQSAIKKSHRLVQKSRTASTGKARYLKKKAKIILRKAQRNINKVSSTVYRNFYKRLTPYQAAAVSLGYFNAASAGCVPNNVFEDPHQTGSPMGRLLNKRLLFITDVLGYYL